MALNSLFCADVPLSNYSLTHPFPFMFWRWLKWAPFEFFAPSPLLRVRSWLHHFYGHCEQQAMRDEGVIYVAGHPLVNRRCTRLPGCIRLRNDLYCVKWGVKLYSLTHLKIWRHFRQLPKTECEELQHYTLGPYPQGLCLPDRIWRKCGKKNIEFNYW